MKETDLDLTIENDMQPTRAPRFLLILVILTLLNTGLALLGGILSFLAGKPSQKEIEDSKNWQDPLLN